MKRNNLILIILFSAISLLSFSNTASGDIHRENLNETILVISSYNPESERISSFISSFEKAIVNDGSKYEVMLENLACDYLADHHRWTSRMKELLNIHDDSNLKAIILLGQEAWATFASISSDINCDVPIFVCYGSITGIDVSLYDPSPEWFPPSENFVYKIKRTSRCILGGMVASYNVDETLKLIRSLYPDVENLALVTDNSYGGISLQSYFRSMMQTTVNYKNIFYIDSRKYSTDEAVEIIKNLPVNSAVIIGSWRVDKDGLYYLSSSLNAITAANPTIPIFSLTGSGMGSDAIGGFFPLYNYDPAFIYNQIDNYYRTGAVPNIKIIDNQYKFNKNALDKMGINSSQLPVKRVVVDPLEKKVKVYQRLSLALILFALCMALFTFLLMRMNGRNIKLRKYLEENNEQLREAKKRAEASDKLKSAFLANMSHEIRTPLNAIVGFSSLLCEDDVSETDRDRFKDIIVHNSQSLLKLINDILDISRLESDSFRFNLAKCDVIDICHKAMSTTYSLRKEGIKSIFNPPVERYIIYTDEFRLMQVLVNFLTNAWKFTESGSVELSVRIEESLNRVSFIVSDTGCGILKENRAKIFERFEKIDEFQKGFGLGLAITSQIASKIGGKVYLDDTYTAGTRIVFEHPISLSDNVLALLGGGLKIEEMGDC